MNMDDNRDLKPLFQKVKPKSTALQERVMSQIREEQFKKERFFMKYKKSMFILAGTLLTVSTGFAAAQYQSLTNNKGEIIYEEKPFAESPNANPKKVYTEEEKQRLHRMNEVWFNEIKPGEVAAIYIVPNNPNHVIDIKTTPHEIKDFAKLKTMVKVPGMPLPETLSGSETYTFNNASVFMLNETDFTPLTKQEQADMAKQLLAKAQASGKDFALMPLEFTDTFWTTRMFYSSGDRKITLSILNNRDQGSITLYRNEKIKSTSQKIKIHGREVLKSDGDTPELNWIYDDPSTGYTYLYTLALWGDNTDDLTRIAEAIIPESKAK